PSTIANVSPGAPARSPAWRSVRETTKPCPSVSAKSFGASHSIATEVAALAGRGAQAGEAVRGGGGQGLRREPFDRDVGRRARERERGAAHAASREQRSRDATPDERRTPHPRAQ